MIFVYLFAAVLVAILGRKSRCGFLGTLLLSLLLTPLLVGLAALLFGKPRPALSSD